jgi:hypothetical protein
MHASRHTGTTFKSTLLSFSCALCLLPATPTHAVTDVAPGTTVQFTAAEGGSAQCRRGDVLARCETIFGETAARPAVAEVETKVDISMTDIAGNLGIPLYSRATIYNDIFIPGSPDNLVDVEISVDYDVYGNFLAVGLYTLTNGLSLSIEDLTAPGEFAASVNLDGMQRQGDQGFSDASVAEERAVQLDDSGKLQVRLRRGHNYRINFQLQSSAVTFILGKMRADAFARRHSLAISVATDTTEQLDSHDQDIKNGLASVEATLQTDIAVHDADIKQELADIKNQLNGIQDDLDEIKLLLITPQGLRPGFPVTSPPGNNGTTGNSNAGSQAATGVTTRAQPLRRRWRH